MIYRDSIEAARARRDQLRRELAGMRRERTEAAAARRRTIVGELATLRARLKEADRRVALRVVHSGRIARPCPASWAAMSGDERARLCGLCEKKVYDLSGLTATEGARLLAEHGEGTCVRLYRRRDGTVITRDCELGASRSRWKVKVAAGVIAAGAVAVAAGALSLPLTHRGAYDDAEEVMGEAAIDDPEPRGAFDGDAFVGKPAWPEAPGEPDWSGARHDLVTGRVLRERERRIYDEARRGQ